jgi:hypothetical protein
MNPQYILFVDFPLHSTHAAQRQNHGENSIELDGKSTLLHPVVSSISKDVIERLKARSNGGRTCEVSLVSYPIPSTPYTSYYHAPWRRVSKSFELKEQNGPLPEQDPYDQFLEIFDEIPPVASIEVIWILHEDRLTSATSLSYRLSQTLRHLYDLKGVRTRIVLGPSLNVPHHFERVLSSLNIDIFPSPQDIPLDNPISIRFQTRQHPYSASSIRMNPNSQSAHLDLLSWPHLIPLAFQLVGSIQLARIPLHLLDGQLLIATLHDSTAEDSTFYSPDVAHFVRPIARAASSVRVLPEWNHEECHWEYPKNCTLTLGEPLVLYRGKQSMLIRKLALHGSGFSHWLSQPSKTFTHPIMTSNHSHSQWDFIQQTQDLDDFFAWIAKQAWMTLNPDSPQNVDMNLDNTPQSLQMMAEWIRDASTAQISAFFRLLSQIRSSTSCSYDSNGYHW